jgi:predicted DNA binding CopG/RHH family protein
MKMSKLSKEEREILEAFEKGNLKRAKAAASTQKRHQEYAEAMFRKDARINIRLSSKDLRGLQKRALAEGIPYQTLIASILHKYVAGVVPDLTLVSCRVVPCRAVPRFSVRWNALC